MVMLAKAATPRPLLDLPQRTFASTGEGERARLGVGRVLRGLACAYRGSPQLQR